MNHVVLVDGPSIFHIAYHSRPPFEYEGQPTGALVGFADFMWRVLTDTRYLFDADYLGVAFEGRRNFRTALSPAYKAHRTEHPIELVSQVRLIKGMVTAMGAQVLEAEGYEADDMIGTYARLADLHGAKRITIVSRDKDLMQLVNVTTELFDPITYKFQDEFAVLDKFGVVPAQLVDLFALMGDTVDGVAGIPGVGPKKGAALIAQFGTLDRLLAQPHLIESKSLRDKVIESIDAVRLARELVRIERHAPAPVPIEALALAINHRELAAYLDQWGVTSIASTIRQKAREDQYP